MKKRKISPRHYKQEMYDTKRAVLSYEQLPLDDYDQTDKKDEDTSNRKLSYKKIFLVCLVLVLVSAIVFVVFNRFACVGCSEYDGASDKAPLSIKGTLVSGGNFNTFDDGFGYVSDTHYVLLNKDGKELFNSQVAFNKPIMKMNYNATSVVYELGGNRYSVYNQNGLVFSQETDSKLYLADITPEAVYATVTESRDYKAKLSVYNSDNTPLYGYSFEEYYITAMALNDAGTGAVVCGVTAENGVEKSVVYVFDFTEEKAVAFHEINSEVAFACEYLQNNSICVIGENASYVLNGSKFSKLTKNSYSQKTLTAYDINRDTGMLCLSLSRSGDGRNCTIQCINTSGKIESDIETNYKGDYISSYKNRVTLSDGKNAYLYSIDGVSIKEISVNRDSRQIRMCASDAAVVLGLKEISFYKF